jgi:hypothetical protein
VLVFAGFALVGLCPASHFDGRRRGESGSFFQQFVWSGDRQFLNAFLVVFVTFRFGRLFREFRQGFLWLFRIIRSGIRGGLCAFAERHFLLLLQLVSPVAGLPVQVAAILWLLV